MYSGGKTCAPCQFITFPYILYMAKSIVCSICCVYSCTIDCVFININILCKCSFVNVKLIITMASLCFQLSCCTYCFCFCILTFYCTERKASIFIYCQFFIVSWFRSKNIIRIRRTFKQSIASFICCSSCLSFVCYSNVNRRLICYLFLSF